MDNIIGGDFVARIVANRITMWTLAQKRGMEVQHMLGARKPLLITSFVIGGVDKWHGVFRPDVALISRNHCSPIPINYASTRRGANAYARRANASSRPSLGAFVAHYV